MRRTLLALAATCAVACGDDGRADPAAPSPTAEPDGEADGDADEEADSASVPAVSAGASAGGSARAPTAESDADGPTDDSGGLDSTPEPTAEPDPNARPVAPGDYGVFKFAKPVVAESELTHHARAGYGVVAVYAEPSKEAEKIGFLRLGMTTRAGDKIAAGDCRKGWYPLEVGGFACASKGLMVEKARDPFMKEPPSPPEIGAAFPYKWAYVKQWNSPMWWRPPTKDERELAMKLREIREAERKGEPPPEVEPPKPAAPKPAAPKPAAPAPAPPDGDSGGLSNLPTLDGPPPAPPVVEDPTPAAPPAEPEPALPVEPPEPEYTEEDVAALPLSPDHGWLEKGYFLSVDRKVRENGKTWWHTSRGGYVSVEHAYEYKPKDFEGVVLGPDLQLPVGWAMSKSVKVFTLKPNDKVALSGRLERRDFVNLVEETEIHGKTYMLTADDKLIRKEDLVMPEPQPMPKGLDPWERWIDVDLESQILVGYEGAYPAFTTLVSTGKKGSEEESFETPVGRWRIVSKQITSNMDGTTAADGNYAIQDVPWVMYFEGSYALHGAFWHRSFGYTRSHGCVNLGPSDARWLFNWTTPFVPDGWHGAHSGDDNPGTTVVIRRGGARK